MPEPLLVYLPAGDPAWARTLAPGSAIVGPAGPGPEGRITIDYEGRLYEQTGMERFADRVHHAASRATARYPTVARLSVEPDDLLAIGRWDDTEGEVVLDEAEDAVRLADHLGMGTLLPTELQATGAHYEQRRTIAAMLASTDPSLRATAEFWQRQLASRER